jgi:hypothetical protein
MFSSIRDPGAGKRRRQLNEMLTVWEAVWGSRVIALTTAK